MEDLETRMRDVLLQLALLSNGRTSSFEASGSSEPDYTPTLAPGDDPAGYFARRYDAARDDDEREHVLEAARDRLDQERRSRGDRSRVETAAQRDARIVAVGEGWEARDVANHFKCGIRDVWKARESAGRCPEWGYLPRELGAEERQAEARRMADVGMRDTQIAFALNVSASTIRRDLGRKV